MTSQDELLPEALAIAALLTWQKEECERLRARATAAEAELADMTSWAYRVGEHQCIEALLADRDETTVYLKVEALHAEQEQTEADIAALHRMAEAERQEWQADNATLRAERDRLKAALERVQFLGDVYAHDETTKTAGQIAEDMRQEARAALSQGPQEQK